MSSKARRVWLGYAGIIFLAGALSGGVFGWRHGSARQSRPMPMGSPSGKHLCEHFRAGLEQEFKLSPDQLKRIDPILDRRARGFDEIFSRARGDLDTLTASSNKEVKEALNLSSDQAAKLADLSRPKRFGPRGEGGGPRHQSGGRFEEHPERHGGPSRHPPGGMPPGGHD